MAADNVNHGEACLNLAIIRRASQALLCQHRGKAEVAHAAQMREECHGRWLIRSDLNTPEFDHLVQDFEYDAYRCVSDS